MRKRILALFALAALATGCGANSETTPARVQGDSERALYAARVAAICRRFEAPIAHIFVSVESVQARKPLGTELRRRFEQAMRSVQPPKSDAGSFAAFLHALEGHLHAEQSMEDMPRGQLQHIEDAGPHLEEAEDLYRSASRNAGLEGCAAPAASLYGGGTG